MMPPKKAVLGQLGKAVGCVPPTALLFVALWQRLRSILILEKNRISLAVNWGRCVWAGAPVTTKTFVLIGRLTWNKF
jgi:hypothetical protein